MILSFRVHGSRIRSGEYATFPLGVRTMIVITSPGSIVSGNMMPSFRHAPVAVEKNLPPRDSSWLPVMSLLPVQQMN